jgi:hypothetical protein
MLILISVLLLSEHQMSKACKPSTKHCSSGGRKRCKAKYFRFSFLGLLVCADDRIVTYASYDYSQTACPFYHTARRHTFYVCRCVLFLQPAKGLDLKKIDGLDIVTANINIKITLSLECRRFLRYALLDFGNTGFLQWLYWQKIGST